MTERTPVKSPDVTVNFPEMNLLGPIDAGANYVVKVGFSCGVNLQMEYLHGFEVFGHLTDAQFGHKHEHQGNEPVCNMIVRVTRK
jgi:hypothetical protein